MAQELTDDEVFGAQGQPAPATSPGEVGDDEVFGTAEDSGARMRYSVGEALKKNPDQVARIVELRTQTGMGEDLIERNFDEVDRYARTQETDKLRTSSPKLAKQLEDPEFAAISNDDLENLKGWEYFVEGTKQGLQKDKQFLKRAGAALYAGVVPRANEAFYGLAQAATEALLPSIAGALVPSPLAGDASDKLTAKFSEVRQQNAAYAESLRSKETGAGFTESAVYSGLESVGTNLVTLPLRNAQIALGAMTGSAFGREYGEARDEGLPLGDALTYATTQALVERYTESVPVGKLLDDLDANSGLVKTLVNQLPAELLGEQVATGLGDAARWAAIDANQGKTFKDYIEERPNAALQTFIATLVSTGVQTSSVHAVAKVQDSYSQRIAAAQAAERTPEVFKQINQLAEDSALRERSPQAFQQFVEDAAKDGPVQDVYVDATTLRDTLQQAGVEPPPSVAAQLEEALATQGDVRIPLGEYAAQIAASPAGAALLPYIRTSPEAMSQTEAKEFLQESAEQFKGDATKALEEQQFDTARQESAKAVETELLAQLNTANRFTPDVNSAYAAMTGNFYNVQSDALGISPEEMYVKYPLRIQAESVAGGATLDQGELAANANASYNQDNPGTVGPEAEGVKVRIETALAQSKTGTIEEADHGQIEQRQQAQPDVGDLPAGDPKLDDGGLAANDDRGATSRDQAADRSETSPRAVRQAVEDFAVQGLNAPAFKRFMQGAFFVTPDGAPVVFYHGSQNADKTTFDESRLGGSTGAAESGLGFFITGSKTGANLYAKNKRNASKQGTRYETVTNVKNPYVVESLRDFKGATTLEDFRGIRASLEAAGYDSIYSKSNRWVVAFNPEAIKSLRSTDIATGKSLRVARGTFAAEDARVFYQNTNPQTETPEFKKWFGDSKVVDEKGDPLVVYHGTNQDIKSFRSDRAGENTKSVSSKGGFFFTQTAAEASDYAKMSSRRQVSNAIEAEANSKRLLKAIERAEKKGNFDLSEKLTIELEESESEAMTGDERGANVLPVYVSIQNPMVFDMEGKDLHAMMAAITEAKEKKHDGVKLVNVFDPVADREGPTETTQWVAFKSEQIKSAIGNSGAFDPTSPNILDQENRGSISFASDITKSPSVISLLQKADLTTFFHESGHFYLEVLSDIASQENAPPRVAQDMQKILDWFGVKDIATWRGMSLEDKRPYHEQFARGFEAYLFEGKSPNLALNKIFARFRAWMMSVYRSMQALNVELTPEVRGVFDRLLATSEQIQEAQEARAYAPLFDTKPAGMATAEWESYQNAHADATQDAAQTLQTRSLRNMQWLQNARSGKLKELQKAANQKRAAVHREVVEEVKAQPVYAVQNFMRKGDLPGFEGGKGAKLSLPAIRDMLESGTPSQRAEIAKFTSGFSDLLTETDGIHPDELAGMFGFTSGDHLIQAITSAEPEQSAIDGMVDQRMLEKYGDLNSPQELAKAANVAIHNEARGKFIAAELQALNKATGQKKLLVKAAKEFADQIIARKKIRDVQPARYEAAESRAARNALKAYTKGKGGLTEAATEKRNQIVNHYAARAAYDALDTVDKGVRYLGKFDVAGSRKNLDPEYLDQIDALLDRFNLSKSQSLRNIDKAKTLAEWITAQEEQGLSPVIPDELRNEAFRKHYKDMAVEEFQGLIDSVKNIEHLGRLKKKLLTAVDQREFEAAVDEIRDSIEDNAKRTVPERRTSDRGLLVDAGKLFRSFVAEHRKFASLVQELDGFEDGGPAWEYLVRTLNTAGDFEAVENEKATIALEALFKPVFGKKALRAKTYFPTIGKSFTYEERLGIALNVGNEANRERVLSGELLSPQQLDTILDTLTAPDWTLVQGVWDYLESFRPQIAAKERRVTGVEPKWVEAAPVRTKFGELKGGYYPIKYDALRSSRSESDIAAEVQRQTMQGLYTRAQTRRGHLKARSESTGRPVRYDLGVVFEHVSQVVHDLAWHEYLIDANRLLKDPAVDASIRAHYGPEKLRSMKDALEAVAKGQVGPQSSFGATMNHIRFGATISGLGWKLSTALLQPLGLTQSMSRIGVKWVAKGAAHWLGDAAHLENSIRIVGEKSAFMRLRAKTMQREINEIRNKVSGKDSRIQASYFWMIQKMQLVADMPTWWGRYEKAMSEADMTEAKAIALADQAVVDAQGSGQIKDLSGIERGSEGQKLFTVFYSFFNTTFNLTARAAGRTNFKNPTSIALFAADLALLYAIPATLGMILKQALKGEWEEPEEALAGLASQLPSELAGYVMGTMVGLRELSATARALSGQSSSYTGPASIRLFSELQKVGVQSEQGDADAAFWKALNNVGGILFHYPSGQINQTAEGLSAILNGDTENPLVLISGPK